jgi:hypothetical protein
MKNTLSLLIRCTLVLGACSALLVSCKKASEKSRGGSNDKPEASETQQGVQDPKPNVPDPAELPNVPDPAELLNVPDPAELPNVPDPAELPNVPDPAELPNVPDPAKQLEDPTDPTEEDG